MAFLSSSLYSKQQASQFSPTIVSQYRMFNQWRCQLDFDHQTHNPLVSLNTKSYSILRQAQKLMLDALRTGTSLHLLALWRGGKQRLQSCLVNQNTTTKQWRLCCYQLWKFEPDIPATTTILLLSLSLTTSNVDANH